jgi:hypothetical protein
MGINHGDRHMRWRLRRIIGCQLLPLLILWHVDGATRDELPWAWGVNNRSTYVSSMAVTKDVLIFNHKEQCARMRRAVRNLINYPLICGSPCLSFLLGPICRQWSSIVLSASHDDILYSIIQSGINSEDNITIIQNITTFTRDYRRRESIVLGMVTDLGVGPNSYEGNGWIAIYRPRREPQTINNRADIGAELPMLGIDRRIGLIPSGVSETPGLFGGGVGFGERSERVVMLPIGDAAGIAQSLLRVRMTLDDAPSGNRRRDNECRDSSKFPLLSSFLVCICLIVSSLLCIRYAVYNCSYAADGRYYIFIAIGFLFMLGSVLTIASIFGFFPSAPIPHLCLAA